MSVKASKQPSAKVDDNKASDKPGSGNEKKVNKSEHEDKDENVKNHKVSGPDASAANSKKKK